MAVFKKRNSTMRQKSFTLANILMPIIQHRYCFYHQLIIIITIIIIITTITLIIIFTFLPCWSCGPTPPQSPAPDPHRNLPTQRWCRPRRPWRVGDGAGSWRPPVTKTQRSGRTSRTPHCASPRTQKSRLRWRRPQTRCVS